MRVVIVDIFVKSIFFIEKLGIKFIRVPKITPNKKTLNTYRLLKEVYTKAEKNGIKVWLTGSWAITARNGSYFKNIDDIDFTMRTREDEKKMGKLLTKIGLVKDDSNPMSANRFIDKKTNIHVDYGSVTYPETIYYQMNLKDDEKVKLNGFSFKVIPFDRHLKLYKNLLFRKGRSVKKDLQKLKILYMCY